MTRRLLVLVGILLAALGTAAPAAAAAPAPRSAAALGGYYLSLGDSLAFGYQPDLVAAGDLNAADYTGYAEDFAAMRPHLTLVNYGCPGETTGSMIAGGCPWPGTLHDPHAGSQLAAAAAFLQAHGADTSLISVDIGSNDLLALLSTCGVNPACIGAGITAMAGRYGQIVGTLRALAPRAQLVLFNFYNPLALTVPGSDQLAAVASSSVADAFGAINHVAGAPSERAFLCARTWECTSYANIHPTDLGYRALAVALLQALPASS